MGFEKLYLIGNGRVADDCLMELHNRNIEVTYIEVIAEKFGFTRKLCERCGIEFCHIDKKDINMFLMDLQAKTLIISAHNSYLFSAEVVEKKNLTILNLHIAYLPEYRGMNPSTWAIYDQKPYVGATWHMVEKGIDNGRILVQEKVFIDEDDTAMKLMLQCFQTGIKLFRENLDYFLSGRYDVFASEKKESRLYLSKELPNQGMMDLAWDFEKAYAFVRSMDYSGANLMPLPRLEKDGRVYEIVKYKKKRCRNDQYEKKNLFFLNAEEKILEMIEGGNGLTCWLREVVVEA